MKKSIIAATVLALMASTASAGIVPSGEWLLPPATGSQALDLYVEHYETARFANRDCLLAMTDDERKDAEDKLMEMVEKMADIRRPQDDTALELEVIQMATDCIVSNLIVAGEAWLDSELQ